ncbi:helix-turn-helix domain-containing protein [Tardiphaga sp. 866_E4_N2_1]|jgi:AraC-like DNA-binding protein|uniref:AraC-like ligand-binding domain-containing protein n=1 Tax=unclassified Tardiphaga TaxID=2631404 RepID=UPI003F20EF84
MDCSPDIQTWSTALVEPERRLDYWISAVCEGFLEMDIASLAPASFASELQRGQLDVIGVNQVRGDPQHVYRTRRAIARGQSNFYYLLCKTDRNWSATQCERTAMLGPHDLLLVDSRRPYEFHFPVTSDTISLELPMGWVERWLTAPEQHLGRVIDGQSGWGLALSGFVRQWSPELAVRSPLPAPLLVDQLGALLALTLEGDVTQSPAETSGTAALIDRIRRALRERYAEPGLTAASIAAQLQISERTLHRGLASASVTFSGLLADCRMSMALKMLAEPRFDRVSIGGIGQKVGLTDPSHFIRQCRKYLGVTPGEFRRRR